MTEITIIETAAEVFGADKTGVFSKSRKAENVNARKAAAFILHKIQDISLHKAGVMLHMDHTTVLYNVRKCEQHCELEAEYREKFNRLVQILSVVEDNQLGHA